MEMSCPWLENRAKKDSKKIEKYQPSTNHSGGSLPNSTEATRSYSQVNVIMDVIMVVQGASC